MGDQYLRQCESQLYAQAWVEYELGIHGNNYANFGTLLCDDDGAHGAYNISSGQYVSMYFLNNSYLQYLQLLLTHIHIMQLSMMGNLSSALSLLETV